MSKNRKVIGIDLASSMSVVSVIEGNKAVVIANSEGQRSTPSVILIKDSERKIGASAKRQAIMNPKNTVTYVKRFMGNDYEDKDIQTMIKQVSYEVDNVNGKPKINVDGRQYSPEELSSYIISYLKKTAEDYYGEEVTDAVITCPAFYNDIQRQAVKTAGELAGLNVLRVINEPTAAILASPIINNIEEGDSKNILVVDLGGSTLDYSLCEVSKIDGSPMVEVISSYGDVFLGGQNFDNAIVDWIADEFAKDHSNVDLRKDPMAYSRLVEAAEKAKCELSTSQQTDINLPYITVIDNIPQMLMMTLTRAKYEQLTSDIIDKMIECGKICLKNVNKEISDLDEILLVGGMTRSVNVQEALEKNFKVSLNKSVNPDEAVALGAAIQANIIVGGDGAQNVLLLDVTPVTLGIETMGGVMTKLVEANTTIPVSKSQIFSTAVDNQPSVEIVVLQGERPMAADNKVIGRFGLDGIAPAPRGVPQIEVTFEIDANGIVNVKAMDKGTGKEREITIKDSNNLSQEEIDRIKAEAEKFAEEDKKKAEEIEKINEAESFNFSVKKMMDDDSMKGFITDADKTSLQEALNKNEAAIKERDLKAIEETKQALEKIWNPIVTKMYQSQTQAQQQSNDTAQNPFANMGGDNPFNFSGGNFADAMNNMYDQSKNNAQKTDTVEDVPYEEVK